MINESWVTVTILAKNGHMTPLLPRRLLIEKYGQDILQKICERNEIKVQLAR